MTPRPPAFRSTALVIVVLCVAVFSIYMRALEFGFLHFGDDLSISGNELVRNGFSLDRAAAALRPATPDRWHPAADWSHAAAVSIFGSWAAAHHGLSILLHAINAVLLFAALVRMTGLRAESAAVAILFALHPRHVEPVVWLSARGDLLAGLFLALCLLAYPVVRDQRNLGRWLATAALVFLGQLTGTALCTLPLLLLVLDRWPLGRHRHGESARRLFAEKIPLIGLALAPMAAALRFGEGPETFRALLERALQAAAFVGLYAGKLLWPFSLRPSYSVADAPGLLEQGLAGAAVIVVFIGLAWRVRARAPALLAGGCWYLAMMTPAALLILAGADVFSDSSFYLADIGLLLALIFPVGDLVRARHWPRYAGPAFLALVLVLGAAASRQVMLWKNDIILFRHVVAADGSSAKNEEALGNGFRRHAYFLEAVDAYERALTRNPDSLPILKNLGTAYTRLGAWAPAAEVLHHAAALYPTEEGLVEGAVRVDRMLARTWARLEWLDFAHERLPADPFLIEETGEALVRAGLWTLATEHYERHSGHYRGRISGLNAKVMASVGQLDEALRLYDEALTRQPGVAQLRYERARVLLRMNRPGEASREMTELAGPPWHYPEAWLYRELVFGR